MVRGWVMRAIVVASLFASVFSVTSGAFAADLPPQAPPPARAPAMVVAERFNWTGIYVGAHGGYGWGKFTGASLAVATSSVDTDGWLAGGQIGANYQMGPVVIGIQGDYAYADIKKTVAAVPPPGSGTIKNDFVATASVRVGAAFDRVLLYVKGGGAWTRDKVSLSDGTGGTATGNFNRTGWLAGGGVEWAFYGNWSAFAEYNYLGFGNTSETPTVAGGFPPVAAADVSLKMHIAKAGVNFRF